MKNLNIFFLFISYKEALLREEKIFFREHIFI